MSGVNSEPLELDLPLDPTLCVPVARDIGATCQGGIVAQSSPLKVTWTTPEPLELISGTGGDSGSTLAVALSPPPASPASPLSSGTAGMVTGGSVTLAVSSSTAPQRWCFTYPLTASTLSIQRGTQTSVHPFNLTQPNIECNGLRLLVTPTAGGPSDLIPPRQPPVVTLAGIGGFELQATTQQDDIPSLTGELHLSGVGSRVIGTPTEVIFHAAAAKPLRTTVRVRANQPFLSLKSSGATSVITNDGNQVTSWWDRHQAYTVPIFITIAGTLAALLISTIQQIVAYRTNRHRYKRSRLLGTAQAIRRGAARGAGRRVPPPTDGSPAGPRGQRTEQQVDASKGAP